LVALSTLLAPLGSVACVETGWVAGAEAATTVNTAAAAVNTTTTAPSLAPLTAEQRATALAALAETIPASKAPLMLRLIFHDGATYREASGTGGVNGSIQYELDRPENFGLKRGTNVIRQLQDKLPKYSFADAIVLSAAYAVKITKGPDMFDSIRVGRRDAVGPDPEGRMPEETLSAEEQLRVFGEMGFTPVEMVALLGSHTIGNKGFGEPLVFDSTYYRSLLKKPWENKDDPMAGMIGLASDRVLPDNAVARGIVERFAEDEEAFFAEFQKAFVKLSERGCV
jgi:L-ascorbate peroxidase